MTAIRRRVRLGLCPQDDILFPLLTVREHLTAVAAMQDVSASEAAAAVEQRAEEVGLGVHGRG
jgi:ATP-binding cassette subfamily A (ABC1) protein 3